MGALNRLGDSRMNSTFNVGKYEVRAWALGSAIGPGAGMKFGHWSVTDSSDASAEVITGKCNIGRGTDGEAINDAITAGRKAADALRKKDGG
jgi:hypothetical protein